MGNITRYNAKDTVVMVGGVYITGLGEDMVSGEKDEDNVNASVGAQGDVVANEVNNDLGTITLSVQGTSPQKSYLLELAKTKEMVDIWVINKNIGEKMGGTKCQVKKTPGLEYGAELADREIEFLVYDYTVDNA
mgnify:CR=1 FL=1